MKLLLPAVYLEGCALQNYNLGHFHVSLNLLVGDDNLSLFCFMLFSVMVFGHGMIIVTFSLTSVSADFPTLTSPDRPMSGLFLYKLLQGCSAFFRAVCMDVICSHRDIFRFTRGRWVLFLIVTHILMQVFSVKSKPTSGEKHWFQNI